MSALGEIVNTCLKYGGFAATRVITRSHPRIYMYHSFSKDVTPGSVDQDLFDWQLKNIKRNYKILSFKELSQKLLHENKNVNNTAVITVDDGYRNFYEHAFPVLKENNVTASLYVTTEFIDKKIWLWPDQLKYLVKKSEGRLKQLSLREDAPSLTGNDGEDWQVLNDFCLKLPNSEKLIFIRDLSERLNIDLSSPPAEYSACSWAELEEMQDYGIEIGGHTLSHPSLTTLSESEAWLEIKGSFDRLQEKLGPIDRTFCYPNGQPTDYSKKLKVLVEQAGFLNAATAFFDAKTVEYPFAWRRYDGTKNGIDFFRTLYGVEFLGFALRNNVKCTY